MAAPPLDPRSTKPGRKRLLITLTTLLSFVIGIPFWYKSTQVYRAPLPFEDIGAYASRTSPSSLQLRCHLHVIFASGEDQSFSETKLDSIAAGIQRQIRSLTETSSFETGSCQAGFELLVTLDAPDICRRSGNVQGISVWPCGLGTPSLLKTFRVAEDDAVDERLWEFSNLQSRSVDGNTSDAKPAYEGGLYTVVVLQTKDADDAKSCDTSDGEGGNACASKGDDPFHNVDNENSVAGWRTVVGKYRHAWISGEWYSISVESELVSRIGDVSVNFFGGSKIGSAAKDRSMPISAEGEAILSFSLLNAEPSNWIFDWEFEQLKEQFLMPVVEALNCTALLRVESQVLYYTPKAVESQWVPALNSHVVTANQLPFFVNANEWHLDSSSAAAGRSKIIHFAIYVPAVKEWPLRFQLADGQLSSTNAFTSPGWGGVLVWNPERSMLVLSGTKPPVTELTAKDFEPVAGVFVAQLRTLFGLPSINVEDRQTQTFSLPAYRAGFADWELDILLRRRAAEDVVAAASTLTSLSRLVQELPNMLIMDEIGDQVKSSLAAGTAAHAFSAQGSYCATAEAARIARSLAEAAFFQPSIMSLLYNPTEHHLAIYTPFFVPVLLHAVLAVVKEVSHHRREWKRFKQKQQ